MKATKINFVKQMESAKQTIADNDANLLIGGSTAVATGYATSVIALATGSLATAKAGVILYYGGMAVACLGAGAIVYKAFKRARK